MQHVITGNSWEVASENKKPIAFSTIEAAKSYAMGISKNREVVYEGNINAKP